MRVLLLTHRIPFPPNKGDKIRSFHILEYLRERHEVFLATLIDDADDVNYLTELRARACRVLHARIDQPGRKLFALREMLRSGSITIRYFYSRQLQAEVDNLLDTVDIDAVFCSSSPMAEYLFRSRHADGRLAHAKRFMDLIDVDSDKWLQYAERSPVWSAWTYRYEAHALGAYERRIASSFDRVFVVSEYEKALLSGGVEATNLQALPNGVDLDFFTPAYRARANVSAPTLVFVGVMDYWPNVEGAQWFVEEVLPRVHAELPETRFFIVGSKPGTAVKRLALERGVTVTGFVEDVRDYIAAASVCVAPLLIARGIQNKVLEAMAMGKAVVATPQAFEGVEAVEGEEILVADGADAFAKAVVSLLRDPGEAERVGQLARRCVEQRYTWCGNLAGLARAGL